MNHKSINYESEQNTERVDEVHEAMPAYAVPQKRQGGIYLGRLLCSTRQYPC